MNLPNKITVLRVCLVPVYLVFAMIDSIPHNWLFAFIVFVGASFTDMLDGKIARKNGLITDFGKFLDPLADKVLVIAALVALIPIGFAGVVPIMLIITREFAVSGLRMMAASNNGTVIAANSWGKIKTASQMFIISFTLGMLEISEILGSASVYNFTKNFSYYAVWLLAIYTAISGFVYIWQNRSVISDM